VKWNNFFFRKLPEDFSSCERCGAPLCSSSCNGKWHSAKECQSLTVLSLTDPQKCTFTECDPNQNCYLNENFNASESENGDNSSNSSITESKIESQKLILKIIKLLNTLLTPLRTLLIMEESTELANLIVSLQSHSEIRSKLPIGQFFENQFLDPLRSCIKEKVW